MPALKFFIGAREPASGTSGDGGFFTFPAGGALANWAIHGGSEQRSLRGWE
jgi:hypothetical protein